ncbi:MAG: T9SS type A sorting domain-containing protein, partial [Cryomorphaceae bacterium]|nr:T9SS type A sorting domain-containing protein [Cryomorphaceae bacterium]
PGGGGSGAQSSDPADNHGGHGGTGMIVVSAIRPGIGGTIFKDLNANCTDDNELGMAEVLIQVMPGDYVTETNAQGLWALNDLPVGTYTVYIDTNKSPMVICQPASIINVLQQNQYYSVGKIGAYNTNCPILDISIHAPTLRRCFQNQKVFVSVCNDFPSTIPLNSSYVDVDLDPLMTVTNATLPYTSLGNNMFRFQTGNINPGQCVDFNISTTISCSAMNGQTLCMSANLYPVESCVLDATPSDPPSGGGGSTGGGTLDGLPAPCTLPWDQSSLSVDGWCENDTIYFTITNTGELGGGDMECYSPVWVTVDGVVTFTDSIMIQGGQTVTYSFPGDGATWILNAEQHPLHPGNSHPNAHVEACGDTSNWTSDLVNDFPLDDADPVVDIYCGVVTGSYDPNDKTGYPSGQSAQHYVQLNQQLQYVIRFQNTGTDTAFTVVIRDTLDTDLNIFTVTPGVSSHDYEFRMYGPRVLEWTFNNINLPDSTTDLEGSNGFVTFHVEQVPDLSPGTEITNDADIYFDFNEPITTNTTMHRIFDGFFSVASLEEMAKKHSSLKVYPNPSSGSFTIESAEQWHDEVYELYDQSGRKLLSGVLSGTQSTIQLPFGSGLYYLKIRDEVVKVVKE